MKSKYMLAACAVLFFLVAWYHYYLFFALCLLLISCVLPVTAGFIFSLLTKKTKPLFGSLFTALLLILMVLCSPPLSFSCGDYQLSRFNVFENLNNILTFSISLVWYFICGSIGVDIYVKIFKNKKPN